jgi:transposase
LLRQRGERVERSFAHLYESGGMRRTHLRRHENIVKRLLIHACAFNLGLVMRKLTGRGTPRGLRENASAMIFAMELICAVVTAIVASAIAANADRRNLQARRNALTYTCSLA